ncbi:hypothetical protein [Pedobacter terrae]|uniref:hypothetical protein n=1 Tax=Pedobacter terrae TaxID=405671 RepID=UPI002FF56D53
MEIQISIYILEKLLEEAAEMGGRVALSRIGKLKPYLKKAEAFRLYGRRNVERWIAKGLVTARKDGSHSASWRIEWLEIESVSKAKALIRYL